MPLPLTISFSVFRRNKAPGNRELGFLVLHYFVFSFQNTITNNVSRKQRGGGDLELPFPPSRPRLHRGRDLLPNPRRHPLPKSSPNPAHHRRRLLLRGVASRAHRLLLPTQLSPLHLLNRCLRGHHRAHRVHRVRHSRDEQGDRAGGFRERVQGVQERRLLALDAALRGE